MDGDATRAAQLLWDDASEVDSLSDPRTPQFASEVLNTLSTFLAASPGVVQKIVRGASAAAEDLNVGQFQGLVEVVQNADDVRASEVRFAFRDGANGRQLLVVHNGQPITFHNILGMALPFLTTKTNRVDQRGRFGIGLKTLRRIGRGIAIHSAPYHFSGDDQQLSAVAPEPALPGFYQPDTDTLLAIDLVDGFDDQAFFDWYGLWEDDALIFLDFVHSFRWCSLQGDTLAERSLAFGIWKDTKLAATHSKAAKMVQRRVQGTSASWDIWKATVAVPGHLHPAHKKRSATTDISIALAHGECRSAIHIGFKTRVPTGLPFSIDAQFDPSTAREELIENPWNKWLIERCGEIIADVASASLASKPVDAWRLVPLAGEDVGNDTSAWLRDGFAHSLARARDAIGSASILTDGVQEPLKSIAYETANLTGFLYKADIEALAPGHRALPDRARDRGSRWRTILAALDVSKRVGTTELLEGFDAGLFDARPVEWWVGAASLLTKHHPGAELFGRRFWLSDQGHSLECLRPAQTDRPLLQAEGGSAFCDRWNLLECLNQAYNHDAAGLGALDWLEKNAAFARRINPARELAAFAERYREAAISVNDEDLREIRDKFDLVDPLIADELGRKVGDVLLLDAYEWVKGKKRDIKAKPTEAYLCRTLDGEFPYWPIAAGELPGIRWLSARYDAQLKSGATRARRRGPNGIISRGPRKFLMLLGAEAAPRLLKTGIKRGGGPTRQGELRAAGAEQVGHDYTSPDLQAFLQAVGRFAKRDVKGRSAALLMALSRNWDRVYHAHQKVPSEHVARVHTYIKAEVTAEWLNALRDAKWVAVGNRGELVQPAYAVIKTSDTRTLYDIFVAGIESADIHPDATRALRMIAAARVGDLLGKLEELRDSAAAPDGGVVDELYRAIAKRIPKQLTFNSRVGELPLQEFRRWFSAGAGLIRAGDGEWRRPEEVRRGKDIFHEPSMFVPPSPATASIWLALGVRMPSLQDCLDFLSRLPSRGGVVDDGLLIDIYRYMDPLVAEAERKHKLRLKSMPLVCGGKWHPGRPVLFVEDPVLRTELAKAAPSSAFWDPPCDSRSISQLIGMIGVDVPAPQLRVVGDLEAASDRGMSLRARFGAAVEHLSNELARNDPGLRESVAMPWDTLKAIPLYVHEAPFNVMASDSVLSAKPILFQLKALMRAGAELHVFFDAMGDREQGGRAMASLFPHEFRRRIDGEWALAWAKSLEAVTEKIRLASDEEHLQRLEGHASKLGNASRTKIKVSAPASRQPSVKARTLKEAVGSVASVTVSAGNPDKATPPKATKALASDAPNPSQVSRNPPETYVAYTVADLEQRGWEVLRHALETSPDEKLADFRRRHGVGADGAINWKTFVEMKATGRSPQTSISMTSSEFERAREKGDDFILALVSGLEDGHRDEVRLIFDPANRAVIRPTNGVSLTGLLDIPSVLVQFDTARCGGTGPD